MTFTAHSDGEVLCERTYYSIGGEFVLDDDESGHRQLLPDPTPVPYPFVVTAPTNGAAGIIPAVLHYAVEFVPGTGDDEIVKFLLVAGALGAICKARGARPRQRNR
jgi:hypothetical protein